MLHINFQLSALKNKVVSTAKAITFHIKRPSLKLLKTSLLKVQSLVGMPKLIFGTILRVSINFGSWILPVINVNTDLNENKYLIESN